MEDSNIQKTYIHRHHNPIHIQPPPTTQVRSNPVPLQQAAHIRLTENRIQTRRDHHPQHPTQQRIPNIYTQTTPPNATGSTTRCPHTSTKMGHIYIHWKRNHTHHQPVQTHQHKNCIPHQQHNLQPPNTTQAPH